MYNDSFDFQRIKLKDIVIMSESDPTSSSTEAHATASHSEKFPT
jgi:hypothetical protein